MSIIQFLRILWAHRLLIISMTVVSIVLAVVIVEVIPPRYEAKSRVMLDVIKPDPVTGQVIATNFLRAYTKTQEELVKDYQVASKVVDDLGWANDPVMRKKYRERSDGKDLDFNRWAVLRVIKGTTANLIDASNIMEIGYDSPDPETARRVADAIRKAYMESSLDQRRLAARRNADWYAEQANKAKGALIQEEQAKAEFERSNGVMLQDNNVDVDSARLQALATQGSAPILAPSAALANSPTALALAQLDADLLQASKTFGPNHPQLLEMRRRRELLAKQAADERAAAASAAQAAVSAAGATNGLLEAQKSRVMAQREKVEHLRLLQDEVDLRREQYNKAASRAAELGQEAEATEAGITPLGAAVTPQEPIFPKKTLLVTAATVAGLGLGLVIALLKELVGRRIRSPEDLRLAVDVPVLAIIYRPESEKPTQRKGLAGLLQRLRHPGLRTAKA
jgi:uncharacterized protein involved in exopolysaccharide biosynthesis